MSQREIIVSNDIDPSIPSRTSRRKSKSVLHINMSAIQELLALNAGSASNKSKKENDDKLSFKDNYSSGYHSHRGVGSHYSSQY